MNVNSLLEGASPLQHQQAESAKLASKWEKSGLLEGLNGHESEKANMAVLLENQARQLVNESNSLGASGAGTNINAGNSEAWAGVALPLVRRVFGEIVAKDLVSVQPMNLPSGLIFYLDFQYGQDQFNIGSGGSLYGANSDKTRNVLPSKTDQDQGLYGAGRFGYSINETSSLVTGATSASALFNGILQGDSEFSASIAVAGEDFGTIDDAYYTVQVPLGTNNINLLEADFDALRTFKISSATGTEIAGFYPQFTRINGTNIEFLVSGAADAAMNTVTVTYSKGPDNLDDRGDFEDGQTSNTAISNLDIPTIDVKLNSDTVTAKTRKLKAQWTPEFAQDLNAYHSIDAEAELTSILSEYISMEIDLEILDMLIRNADTVEGWSAKVGTEVSTTTALGTNAANLDVPVATFTRTTSGTNEYYTKMSWFQTLGVKLQSVSNAIHQKTLRGGANFMVVSPKVSTILESIPGFAADSPGDSAKYAMGVQKIGAINSRYTVYKNPYMTENTILMGYKGNQFLETGAVFAPYIPLIMTPLVYDPVSFTPRKGIMTRYAKKMVRPDFYGKVLVQDLDLV
jgi:hypothetical protein